MSDLVPEEPSLADMFRVIFMQQQRIYDVLLIILRAHDSALADLVDEKHSKFEFIGALPFEESDE